MSNEQTIRDLYAAFQSQDVETITGMVSEDVDWNNDRVTSRECPWNGNFSTRAKMPGFFQAIGENLDFSVFDVQTIVASGSSVAVYLHFECTVRKNGRPFNNDATHFWTFNAQGKIIRYRHFNDTGAELAAWRD